MNKELIDTVKSLGGTALMGGMIIQFTDTTFVEALKKIYETGVSAERKSCADLCEKYGFDNHCGTTTDVIATAIRARGQA